MRSVTLVDPPLLCPLTRQNLNTVNNNRKFKPWNQSPHIPFPVKRPVWCTTLATDRAKNTHRKVAEAQTKKYFAPPISSSGVTTAPLGALAVHHNIKNHVPEKNLKTPLHDENGPLPPDPNPHHNDTKCTHKDTHSPSLHKLHRVVSHTAYPDPLCNTQRGRRVCGGPVSYTRNIWWSAKKDGSPQKKPKKSADTCCRPRHHY